jgi:hypothetical protein
MRWRIGLLVFLPLVGLAQEASSGFDLRSTVSGGGFFRNDRSTAGFRAMLYPTWKLSEHWAVTGALQVHSRPYYYEELTTQGYGVKGDVLQAHLSYSRFWGDKSMVVRAGQLSSAFGSYLLRYDDATNPLIDIPLSYGYYYKGVSSLGLAGAQVDATAGRFDGRVQFANSSPANRRSVFDREQYGNWTGGAGWTIRQGLRIGVSGYRGPYLHREYKFYQRGDGRPRDHQGTAQGVDLQWGHRGWNVNAEWQRFRMDYIASPNFFNKYGYGEVRRVLHPRVYVAARIGFLRSTAAPNRDSYEFAVGFRPNRHQLIKVGYEVLQGKFLTGTQGNTFGVQLVSTLPSVSWTRR